MNFYSSLCFVFVTWSLQSAFIFSRSITPTCTTEQCLRSAKILEKSMNEGVNPCDDFYKFACGNWIKTHPTLTDYVSSSTLEYRKLKNNAELRGFFERNNSDIEPVAVHKARKLFTLCLNTENLDRKGLQPLNNLLNQIGVSLVPSEKFDIIETSVRVARLVGLDVFYHLGVSANPYNQTENKLSISQPMQDVSARIPTSSTVDTLSSNTISKSKYTLEALKLLCSLSGNGAKCYSDFQLWVTNAHDSVKVNEVMQYSSSRAQAVSKAYSMDSVSTIPQLYNLKYLQNLTNHIANQYSKPSLNWTKNIQLIFSGVENITLDLSQPEKVELIFEEQFVRDILHFIYSHHDYDHELGIAWHIMDTLAQYLSRDIRFLKWNYTYDLSDTSMARADWCTSTVSHLMGMAASYYYATTEDYKSVKKDVSNMVADIETVFEHMIKSSTWLDHRTRQRALKKLRLMKKYIAFPGTLLDKDDLDTFYNDLEVMDDLLEFVLNKARKETIQELQSLYDTNDVESDRRSLTPVEVNAFYDNERNTMIIPAGILGVPIYGHGLQCLNYGSIGQIIGHEMTHGFDSAGRRYNHMGNLEEWWEPETLNKFNEKANCFKTSYQEYSEIIDTFNLTTDGAITLAENMADNGGFKQALQAYRNYVLRNGEEQLLAGYEGLSGEHLFTIAFANLWCESPTAYSVLSASKDHSPNAIRVNGVVMNSQEFSVIWNCSRGSNMNPNAEKCHLW